MGKPVININSKQKDIGKNNNKKQIDQIITHALVKVKEIIIF